MKNLFKKRSVKIILFVLCFVLCYLYCCLIFTPKSMKDYGGNTYYQGKGYIAEDDNTIDILAVGNSDLYSAFIPTMLYDDYGFTAYNTGRSKLRPKAAYQTYKDVTRSQNIKLLVIEADCAFDDREGNNTNTFAAKEINFLTSPFNYHVRWKHLKGYDFYKTPNEKDAYDNMKGYIYRHNKYKVKVKDYMKSKDQAPKAIGKENKHYLDLLIRQAKKDGADVLFVCFPSQSSWNYAKHNGLKEYANEKGCLFVDYNTDEINVGFDPKVDYKDNGNHLNIYGAIKVTKHLATFINDNYNLENHKDDPKYIKWNEAANFVRKEFKKDGITID